MDADSISRKEGKGFGIQGMKERCKGWWRVLIESARERGTTISITLPSRINSKTEDL